MPFRLTNSVERYGAIPKTIHWLTAALVVLGWMLGTFGDALPRAAQAGGLFIHISVGLSVLALLVVRVGWRVVDPPPLPETTRLGRWSGVAAALGHLGLYALLLAVPIAGVVLQFARGDAIPIFGLFDIVSPWTADRAFARSVKEIHNILANTLVILAALHAAAAIFHTVVLRDRTLRRMLPGAAGPGA
jgi:cytochrome b561